MKKNNHPLEFVSRYLDLQIQVVKTTHICLIWNQASANLDV